ncbi:MAG: DUF5615 family PIN-like protein [Candidatus Poribacteria bacterium]
MKTFHVPVSEFSVNLVMMLVVFFEEIRGAKDFEVLSHAQKDNRIILTFDRDYGELIYHYGFFAFGVVYFRFKPEYPEEPAERLLKILDLGEIELLNKFTVIERDRIRQRVLYL